jgi:hypothetical protein
MRDEVKAGKLEDGLELLAGSCNALPVDAATRPREWGKLTHRKSDTLPEGAMIAATARQHGSTAARQHGSTG